MNIVCPQCGFERNVNPDQFSGKDTVIATCPQCACRFRVSATKGVLDIVPPKGWNVVKAPESQPEEEDIRLVAKRAYEREAERFAPAEESKKESEKPEAGINPWDLAPGQIGWAAAFYQTIIRVMFAASAFFRSLKLQCPKARPFSFYLIICVFQGIVDQIWGKVFYSFLVPEVANDPQMSAVLQSLATRDNFLLELMLRCGLLVFQLYIFSLLMFLIYRVFVPGKVTFDLIFQIMAYSSAPSILCIVPALGSVAGLFWGLGCLAVGVKSALDLNWPRTLVGLLPLILSFAQLFSETLKLVGR